MNRVLVKSLIGECRTLLSRRLSSSKWDEKEESVGVGPDGLILAWHPAESHPYEHTRPIPRKPDALRDTETVLKLSFPSRHREKGPTDQDLQNMLHTSKYSFKPTPRARRIALTLPPIPKFRPGV